MYFHFFHLAADITDRQRTTNCYFVFRDPTFINFRATTVFLPIFRHRLPLNTFLLNASHTHRPSQPFRPNYPNNTNTNFEDSSFSNSSITFPLCYQHKWQSYTSLKHSRPHTFQTSNINYSILWYDWALRNSKAPTTRISRLYYPLWSRSGCI
jgi:hypothetical protein